jgi:ABC-type sugar transport system permease subunit
VLAYYAVFGLAPIARALWMTVIDYRLINPASSPFVGLDNFRRLLDNELFWISLRNTLTYSVGLYIGMLPLALFISVCLTSVRRGRNFYQFVVFLPVVVSLVAMALLFRILLDPQVGPVNDMLRWLGLPTSRFLTGPKSALYSVIGVDIWKNLGFYVVILTAGLLNIPEEMYDAAKVDGASPWQCFWRITLPLLGHTLALTSVLCAMHGLQVFTQVVVLPAQDGGPGTATYVLNLLVYEEAFKHIRFGLATANAFVLFVFVFVITVIQFKIIRPTWSY